MKTDTTERGLESLIMRHMTGVDGLPSGAEGVVADAAPVKGGSGWLAGSGAAYDREFAVDSEQLFLFLRATQPEEWAKLGIGNYTDKEGMARQKFLARLQGEITRRGTVDVLRKGIKHGALSLDLFYGMPSAENAKAVERHAQNRFSMTRQLHFSRENKRSLDLCAFINGLPVITFELKNSLTKQTVEDAIEQYKRDRDPRETLFAFGRCMVHFAVDDHAVAMCTALKGKGGTAKDSWFLPFNQGWNDGAGNPPNPDGLKTDYLWKTVLAPARLTEILENYAQVVEEIHPKTCKKKQVQIFLRYHQLDVVRRLLADVRANGAGQRYLIQHSAGSGKSNSIAWLAHQLTSLVKGGKAVFDSIIVITDRRLLDQQIRETIRGFAQVGSIIGAVKEGAGSSKTEQLSKFLKDGKKVIISTVQTFPFVLDSIGAEYRGGKFAIIIDEAHSSQGGRTAAAMSMALSEGGAEPEVEETTEDKINRIIESRKLLTNASYFAFTATPKNKTLEIFGVPFSEGGEVKHRPFHGYTMKQAIQEGFILDVLKSYTPVASYYRLAKTVEGDPEYDVKKARKKLRVYVESHSKAIRDKAEIMVDHFLEQVLGQNKIGGQARAMVVTGSIQRAIEYFMAFTAYLAEIKSPYRPIVAFSGEPEYKGEKVSESKLNGFSSNDIADRIQEDPYRFLICADKFQTGYDEPLLHTMYVDKVLSGIKAVQTLSRLNRAHPKKHDVFVLDFQNETETIEKSFADYYRTTILSSETDPNKLHTLKGELDTYQVYSPEQIDALVESYLGGADRDKLDPILDACVAVYVDDLDEDGQVEFKGKAKAFTRTYDFLATILPYGVQEWEKLSIFLNFLISKLPAPIEIDLSKGILEAIDMDSYRAEKKAMIAIALPDADAEIEPVPTSGGGRKPEPEMDKLSNIVKQFNDMYGGLFADAKAAENRILVEIPQKVSADSAYQNARKNTPSNARVEHDKALRRVMTAMFKDDAQLFKQFQNNESFRDWLTDTVFGMTYDK